VYKSTGIFPETNPQQDSSFVSDATMQVVPISKCLNSIDHYNSISTSMAMKEVI
jgi:hypothetical protein